MLFMINRAFQRAPRLSTRCLPPTNSQNYPATNKHPASGLQLASAEYAFDAKPEVAQHLNLHQPSQHVAESQTPSPAVTNHQRRNPFNLSPLIFGVLVAVFTTIILGAALGGGLSAKVASLKADDKRLASLAAVTVTTTATGTASSTAQAITKASSSSSSSTTSVASATALLDYIAPSSSVVTVIDTSSFCPSPNGTIYTVEDSNQNSLASFSLTCGYGINDGGDVYEISHLITYSFDDCMRACVGINQDESGASRGGTLCTMVTFSRGMSASWHFLSANCWLHNGTAVQTWNADSNTISSQLV